MRQTRFGIWGGLTSIACISNDQYSRDKYSIGDSFIGTRPWEYYPVLKHNRKDFNRQLWSQVVVEFLSWWKEFPQHVKFVYLNSSQTTLLNFQYSKMLGKSHVLSEINQFMLIDKHPPFMAGCVYVFTGYSLLEKISTGTPSHGQPLNCHAGPCTNTATTRSLQDKH